MQAVNHVATALILKRRYPSASLLGLVIATEAVEYLWVALNVVGLERTVVETPMRSVADIHLVHMPFSHSLLSSAVLAMAIGLLVLWRRGNAATAIAMAFALATASHIGLDILVHAPDIVATPFRDHQGYGTGLYSNLPLVALVVEAAWGVFCWWMYRGSKTLLAVIIALEILAVPFYSADINIGEADLSGHSVVFAVVILFQMVVTSALVWFFARRFD